MVLDVNLVESRSY